MSDSETRCPVLTACDRDRIMEILKEGGGVGVDFTAIRPVGTPLNTKPLTPQDLTDLMDKIAKSVTRSS